MRNISNPSSMPLEEPSEELLQELMQDMRRHCDELLAKYGSMLYELRDRAWSHPDLIQLRTKERLGFAKTRAARVVDMLAYRGLKARFTGPLVTGGFTLNSETDFIIENCPYKFRQEIEMDIREIMLDIPFYVLHVPPRQNSCRLHRSTPGAAMKDKLGSIRTDIQRQSGSAVAAAGERSDRRGCAGDWDRCRHLGALARAGAVQARPRAGLDRGRPA